jgi:uncharacterized protein involved in outer membrane biogenesis
MHLLDSQELSVGIDLAALLSGSVHLEGIIARDLSIALERNGDGAANWSFGDRAGDEVVAQRSDQGLSWLIEDATIERARLSFQSPARGRV